MWRGLDEFILGKFHIVDMGAAPKIRTCCFMITFVVIQSKIVIPQI